MKELHALVDFENVQPSLEALAKLAPGFTDVWLFHGPHQAKQAQALAASHARVTLVPHSRKGKNALHFHLSFYLGYVAAKHPDAELVVVVNDKGYDSMIGHAKALGFTAKRVGFKAPVAKKVVAKKAVAKKAAVPKLAKAAQPVKAANAKPTPAATPTAPKPTPEAKLLTRITKGLAKMGDEAPTKLKSFLSTLKSMQGKDSTAADVEATAQTLQTKGVVQVQGGVVTYPK